MPRRHRWSAWFASSTASGAHASEGDYIEANKVPRWTMRQSGTRCSTGLPPTVRPTWIARHGVDRTLRRSQRRLQDPPPDKCGGGSIKPPPTYAPASNRSGRMVKNSGLHLDRQHPGPGRTGSRMSARWCCISRVYSRLLCMALATRPTRSPRWRLRKAATSCRRRLR